MKTLTAPRCHRFIIACLMCLLIVFFSPAVSFAQDSERRVEISSFKELCLSLNQMQSTGGTIVLTQDITVPAGESYQYNNGRYRKAVVIETGGHTIYVEGYLELWPFLTVHGDKSQKELFHVYPGGELRLVSICLDAGENGVAVIQDEGAFFLYGSEESMGLPQFSCTGQMIFPQTTTAAAYWRYDCGKLPIVRVPAGANFTASMLPDKVQSVVNRDHQEYEEEIPVVWDGATFPTEQERTLVQGKFADGYAQYGNYMPQCLVVWESDNNPFFLNVYLESLTQWYDMIYMYGESPQPGTVYVQSSDDGKIWADLAGTYGYEPVEAEKNEGFSWLLSYDRSESAQERPKYYRLLQILEDGTELYSEALELNDDLIFTVAGIEGGRGGETSPNEGENQLPNGTGNPGDEVETLPPETSSEPSSQPGAETGSAYPKEPTDELEGSDSPGGAESAEPSSNSDQPADSAATLFLSEILTTPQGTEDKTASLGQNLTQNQNLAQTQNPTGTDVERLDPVQTDTGNSSSANKEKTIGIVIVVCILAGSVLFFVFKRKK